MKKVIYVTLLFLLIFTVKVNAKVYNYSCDYSFTAPGTGEKIDFRIRVKDLDEDYIKGKDPSYWKSDSFWKQHAYFMLSKNGTFTKFDYTFGNSGKATDFDGKNKNGCASLWTLGPDGLASFVDRSVDLSKNDIVCPSFRVYRADDIFPDNNSCIINTYTDNPHIVEDLEPNSGVVISTHSYPNNSVTTAGLNCYDTSGNPTRCDSVAGETGIYDKENTVECLYSGNSGVNASKNLYFKLIYNKKDKTLQFNDNGWGYTLKAGNKYEQRDGKYYLTDQELVSKFATPAESNTCPTNIRCSCKWGISLTGEYVGKECMFNDRDDADGECGINSVVNGETVEDPGSNKGKGKKPEAPNAGFGQSNRSCNDILGKNLTKLVRAGIKALQIIGAILAIVYGMISLIPAVMAKDSDGLKKAEKKLLYMAIILLCIFLLPTLIKFIGKVFDYDITCYF